MFIFAVKVRDVLRITMFILTTAPEINVGRAEMGKTSSRAFPAEVPGFMEERQVFPRCHLRFPTHSICEQMTVVFIL